MNNDLKIKIIGDDTSNLLLAFLLLKKGFKVEILKNYNISKKISQEKLFFVSHSTQLVLEDFDLWTQLKNKAYSINSLSLSDMSILNKIDFSFCNFNSNRPNPSNIGWNLRSSDVYELLLNEINKFNNVFSESNIEVNSEKKESHNNLITIIKEKLKKKILFSISKRLNTYSIEFTASLRGYIDNRLYSLVSENGLIILSPINKNLFRVTWFIKQSFLDRNISLGKSFLLDNLSTILPKELMIDQIFGALDISSNYIDKLKRQSKIDNYLTIKNGSVELFDFKLEGLNLSFREIVFIYNQIKKIDHNNIGFYSFLKLKFLIFKCYKLKISTLYYELIIRNNYFLNFLKKIFLYKFKKFKIFKKFIFKFIIYNF